jgi:ferrous iron transport protein A
MILNTNRGEKPMIAHERRRLPSFPALFPLGLLGPGERAEVVGTTGRPHVARDCRSEDMGLRAGRIVEMIAGGGGRGPLLLKVDQSRLALGRGLAMRILVRRLP